MKTKESMMGGSAVLSGDCICAQVPIACWEGRLWARISAQYYNTLEDYQALADALKDLIFEGEAVECEEQGVPNDFRRSLANGSAHASNGSSDR